MKIFLDDFRNPSDCTLYMHRRIGEKNTLYLEKWTIVRNYQEFVDMVSKHIDEITHVSFDHDLSDEHYDPSMHDVDDYNKLYGGFKEKTGLECAKWMWDLYETEAKDLPIIFVHSMNPVGTNNIINEFKSRF